MKKHLKNLSAHCRTEVALIAVFAALIAWSGAGVWGAFLPKSGTPTAAAGNPSIISPPPLPSPSAGERELFDSPRPVVQGEGESTQSEGIKTEPVAFFSPIGQKNAASTDSEQKIKVTLTLEKPDGTKTFSASLPAGATVYDLLKSASAEHDFSLRVKDYSFGVFIEEIDGLVNNPGANVYWMYSVNGAHAPVGASEYKLKEGDEVAWKYQRPAKNNQ